MFKVGEWVRWLNMSSSKTFKAGDWVEHSEVEYPWKITQNSLNHLDNSELKLWKPKEGEWVVRTQVNGKAGVYISGFDVHMWTNDDVYECEPFIGKIPSFIKDK